MKVALVAIAATATFVGALSANADIVKCVDSNGKGVFQESPCPGARPPTVATKAPTFTVVVNEVPVKELLFALARDTKLNIDIHPGLQGLVSLNAVNETLPAILDRVSHQVNIRYRIEGNTIIILRGNVAPPPPVSPVVQEITSIQEGLPPLVSPEVAAYEIPPPPARSTGQVYLDRFVKGGFQGIVLVIFGVIVLGLMASFRAGKQKIAEYKARPSRQPIERNQLVVFLVGVGICAWAVYALFIKANTVDYYLNNYQARIDKIQSCQGQDITRDNECMNAITAQRMFMSGTLGRSQ